MAIMHKRFETPESALKEALAIFPTFARRVEFLTGIRKSMWEKDYPASAEQSEIVGNFATWEEAIFQAFQSQNGAFSKWGRVVDYFGDVTYFWHGDEGDAAEVNIVGGKVVAYVSDDEDCFTSPLAALAFKSGWSVDGISGDMSEVYDEMKSYLYKVGVVLDNWRDNMSEELAENLMRALQHVRRHTDSK